MDIGVGFPRDGLGNDPIAIRDFAQAADQLGYEHICADDHVVGPLKTHPVGGEPQHLPKLDPFVIFGYMASVTTRLKFTTAIMILPQRQTVLFAKQAAAVDVLSGGRMRAGVSVGWNPVEFEVMNEDFHNRGRRMEEQIEVMRALWSQEIVDFTGRWHRIDNVGLNPMPVQRPIPIIMGGYDERAMRRTARIGDGWFVQSPPGSTGLATPESGRETIERMRSYVAEAGRNVSDFAVHAHSFHAPPGATPEDWLAIVEAWRKLDVAYLTFNTTTDSSPTLAKRIEAMRQLKDVVGF